MTTVKVSETFNTKYEKIISTINKYIDQENFWFLLFDYILSVHLSAISSILHMAITIIDTDLPSTTILTIVHAVDFLFYSKILFGFTLSYVDSNSGIKIVRAKQIMKRYLKNAFAFDLFVCFPFEMPLYFYKLSYVKIGRLNRVCRFYYAYKYYRMCVHKLTISKHLRWSYISYWTIFRVQIMANAW